MDDLSALRLQIEWGADEALLDAPVDRIAPLQPRAVPAPTTRPSAFPAVARVPPAAEAAPDLATLHAALDALPYPLRATASTTVAPAGNPAAGLIVVGEAPGPEDDRAGTAYSGQGGQTIDRILSTAGLGRDALLLCFLIPWRPPGGRPPNEADTAACLPFLHRLLALTRPRHLLLLGGLPLRALTGDQSSIRRARGRWTQATIPGLPGPVPALPMLPPDQWLASPANKQATWTDLLALREALTST